jgi:glycogen synthase
VLGAEPGHRGDAGALLASAVRDLTLAGLIQPDVLIGWGETAAPSLLCAPSAVRVFVLPEGVAGPPLESAERNALGAQLQSGDSRAESLWAIGRAAARTVVVPSPSSLRRLEDAPAETAKTMGDGADVVPIRFGCDEPPYDPSSDPAIETAYSPDALAGKESCRQALARQHGLRLTPHTLLLATAPLREKRGGAAILDALAALDQDVVVVVSAAGDQGLVEKARALARQSPARIAVQENSAPGSGSGQGQDRALLGGADALLLADGEDYAGRSTGLALRYGVMPIAPETAANADYLVHYDAVSATGSALLYGAIDAAHIQAALGKAAVLRAQTAVWAKIVRDLMMAAPSWSNMAARFSELALPS